MLFLIFTGVNLKYSEWLSIIVLLSVSNIEISTKYESVCYGFCILFDITSTKLIPVAAAFCINIY